MPSYLWRTGVFSGSDTMNVHPQTWGFLHSATWHDVLLILAVLLVGHIVLSLTRRVMHCIAERVSPDRRLAILRIVPFFRLVIKLCIAIVVISILVEPTFRNVSAIAVTAGLALAFAFKDYGSSLAAGLVTVVEGTYQPGDWIEVDGAYGEVKSINARAVHIVTPDDTEVIIPHSRLWSTSVHNATSGNQGLLCVANFYLHPDHDAAEVRRHLMKMAEQSSYRKEGLPVIVIAMEKPWGTKYRVKAYVRESREQFLFITDLTVRGKAALQKMNVRFAHVPFAETETSLV